MKRLVFAAVLVSCVLVGARTTSAATVTLYDSIPATLPATLSLLGLGLFGIAIRLRRRRRA
jgi:hypothetical protein